MDFCPFCSLTRKPTTDQVQLWREASVIRLMGEIQKYPPLWCPPFSLKHPQDNCSLQNANRHPPKCTFQKRKISPKTEVFGRTSLRTPGQKLRSALRILDKQAFWHGRAARTSTKKLRSEKLRADFSSLTLGRGGFRVIIYKKCRLEVANLFLAGVNLRFGG